MKIFSEFNTEVGSLLKQGAVGVIPTDTVYGIVALTSNPVAVERLYAIRGRNPAKACIVLIAKQTEIFGHKNWTNLEKQTTQQYWPGPVSIILPADAEVPFYLHRGLYSLAYRMPDYPALHQLLMQTGPLLAPSANPEGLPPATTLAEAQAYFGNKVDFYIDGGVRNAPPSRLLAFKEGKLVVLR